MQWRMSRRSRRYRHEVTSDESMESIVSTRSHIRVDHVEIIHRIFHGLEPVYSTFKDTPIPPWLLDSKSTFFVPSLPQIDPQISHFPDRFIYLLVYPTQYLMNDFSPSLWLYNDKRIERSHCVTESYSVFLGILL